MRHTIKFGKMRANNHPDNKGEATRRYYGLGASWWRYTRGAVTKSAV